MARSVKSPTDELREAQGRAAKSFDSALRYAGRHNLSAAGGYGTSKDSVIDGTVSRWATHLADVKAMQQAAEIVGAEMLTRPTASVVALLGLPPTADQPDLRSAYSDSLAALAIYQAAGGALEDVDLARVPVADISDRRVGLQIEAVRAVVGYQTAAGGGLPRTVGQAIARNEEHMGRLMDDLEAVAVTGVTFDAAGRARGPDHPRKVLASLMPDYIATTLAFGVGLALGRPERLAEMSVGGAATVAAMKQLPNSPYAWPDYLFMVGREAGTQQWIGRRIATTAADERAFLTPEYAGERAEEVAAWARHPSEVRAIGPRWRMATEMASLTPTPGFETALADDVPPGF